MTRAAATTAARREEAFGAFQDARTHEQPSTMFHNTYQAGFLSILYSIG